MAQAATDRSVLRVKLIDDGDRKRSPVYSWLLPAFISFLGVIAGGYISDRSSRLNAQQSKLIDLRTQAYVDFANVQAKMMAADGKTGTFAAEFRQAAVRVAIFGDIQAVSAIAEFYRDGLKPCENLPKNDLAMYAGIRERVLGTVASKAQQQDIATVIYGCNARARPVPGLPPSLFQAPRPSPPAGNPKS